MDEDISIIDTNTRNEKIKNFFVKNKKNIIGIFLTLIIIIIGYYSLEKIKEKNKIKSANQYNLIIMNFDNDNKEITIKKLINLVKERDATYSPLALYFLIDNNLIDNKNDLNILFDELIDKTNFDNEIKNLIIYKKALFNAEFESENNLLNILQPLINSNSIWESHALYLLAEYFYSNNEKQKAKEFFNKILILENSNSDIKTETQKRLNRDFGE
tara:strand:+ start:2707 stop:3351 length:645 start_codon:yes stop_codon:yes gene_type:complete